MPFLPAVDAYIDSAPEYAQPVLVKLRKLFHKACPEVEETLKWSVPHFDYKGVLAGMSAHKKHVNVVFWKASLMADPEGLFPRTSGGATNVIRIESAEAMPPDKALLAYIREAARLNESGAKVPSRKKTAKKELPVPADLAKALKADKKAKAAFEGFSPSHRREYIEWISGAKRQETRDRRTTQAIEWLAEGRHRNWKYER